MDIFKTLTLLGVYSNMTPAATWLRDKFFGTVKTYDTNQIAIDVKKNKRKMAPFVSGEVDGKVIERGTFSTNVFEAPYIKPKFITRAADLIANRVPGEAITGAKSPMARAAEQLVDDLTTQDQMISRREEWMVAQLLFTGECPIVGEGVNAKLEFWKTTDTDGPYLAFAAGAQWTAETANPEQDFTDARKTIMQRSGIAPDTAVLGSEAAAALMKNTLFLKQLDNRRVELGQIDPALLPNGVTYLGRITRAGIDLYTYDEVYEDDAGNTQPFVPPKMVLIGSAGRAPTSMAYAVVGIANTKTDQIEFYEGRRVPHSWVSKSPAGRMVETDSRPLPIIHEVGAFRLLKVVA